MDAPQGFRLKAMPNGRSRSPHRNGGSPSTVDLQAWASREAALEARAEMQRLVVLKLPGPNGHTSSWASLCLRRDIRALERVRPSFGVSVMPPELGVFREFDAGICEALRVLDRRLGTAAALLPLNAIYGAWEGGLPAEEANAPSNHKQLRMRVACFNVQGECGHEGGVGAHDRRILSLISALHAKGTVLAVLAEPRLAPGMEWPAWTGFVFYGERSSDPGTVAVLVLEEVAKEIMVAAGVGDERAIWLEVPPVSDTRGSIGVLVLGVYAPQSGHTVSVRAAFWELRKRELAQVRTRTRFVTWDVVVMGDMNLHFPELVTRNRRYAGTPERDVSEMLRGQTQFGGVLKNPPNTPTHVSGTAIDAIIAPATMEVPTEIVPAEQLGVRSDHHCIFAALPRQVEAGGAGAVGTARWVPGGDWDNALQRVPKTLQFIMGWAGTAMRSRVLREWTAAGSKRGTRQMILDRAVWWRATVYTLCGHFGGLVIAAGPRGQRRAEGTLASLRALLEDQAGAEGELEDAQRDLAFEDGYTNLMAARGTSRMNRYLELKAKSPGDAEAFVSGLIKPRRPVEVAFQDEVTGERLSPVDTLDVLSRDVMERGKCTRGVEHRLTVEVKRQVKVLRSAAQQQSRMETNDPFTFLLIDEVVGETKQRRRSLHLPRSAGGAGSRQSKLVVWAILNLAVVLGLIARTWEREISPLRKNGPMVVTQVQCLRPVGYMDDLAGLLDGAWLAVVKVLLEEYMGS